jgi:hypothetical protein
MADLSAQRTTFYEQAGLIADVLPQAKEIHEDIMRPLTNESISVISSPTKQQQLKKNFPTEVKQVKKKEELILKGQKQCDGWWGN